MTCRLPRSAALSLGATLAAPSSSSFLFLSLVPYPVSAALHSYYFVEMCVMHFSLFTYSNLFCSLFSLICP